MELEPLQPSMPSRAQLKVEVNTVCKINFNTLDARTFRRTLAQIANRGTMIYDRVDIPTKK